LLPVVAVALGLELPAEFLGCGPRNLLVGDFASRAEGCCGAWVLMLAEVLASRADVVRPALAGVPCQRMERSCAASRDCTALGVVLARRDVLVRVLASRDEAAVNHGRGWLEWCLVLAGHLADRADGVLRL